MCRWGKNCETFKKDSFLLLLDYEEKILFLYEIYKVHVLELNEWQERELRYFPVLALERKNTEFVLVL
jgi:hypothetical protein